MRRAVKQEGRAVAGIDREFVTSAKKICEF